MTCCRLGCCEATFLVNTKKSCTTPVAISPGDAKRHAGLKLSIFASYLSRLLRRILHNFHARRRGRFHCLREVCTNTASGHRCAHPGLENPATPKTWMAGTRARP